VVPLDVAIEAIVVIVAIVIVKDRQEHREHLVQNRVLIRSLPRFRRQLIQIRKHEEEFE
jgi:hypothetical protein